MSIVFSPNLVLSPTDTGPIDPNAPLLGYTNYVTTTNVEASEASATGYPVSNLANISTAAFWRSSNTNVQYLTAEIGGLYEIDYIGVARHNFGSAGIAVSVEVQSEPAGAWTEIVSDSMLANNNARIFRFTPQYCSAIRLKLFTGLEAPQAAVVYIGKLLAVQQRIYVGHSPITLNRRVEVVSGMSESGNYLGRIVTGSNLTTSASFTHLDPQWYRTNFDPFVVAAQTRPFFWAWRPFTYPSETGFAWLTSDPQPSNMLPNGMMQVSLEMSGVSA
jgi:hypothetical protein